MKARDSIYNVGNDYPQYIVLRGFTPSPTPDPGPEPTPGPEPIEPRNIWIDFKFLNSDFNPKEYQLALGTEKSNGQNRGFKADWQLVDKDENIWRWGCD